MVERVQQEWRMPPVPMWSCRLGQPPFALWGPPFLQLQDERVDTSGFYIPKWHMRPLYSCPIHSKGMAGPLGWNGALAGLGRQTLLLHPWSEGLLGCTIRPIPPPE